MNSNYNDTKKLEEAFAKAVGGAGIEEAPEEPEVRTVIDLNIAMDAEAMQLVGNYVWEDLDRSDDDLGPIPELIYRVVVDALPCLVVDLVHAISPA